MYSPSDHPATAYKWRTIGYGITKNASGSFILCGDYAPLPAPGRDMFLAKINSNGLIQQKNTIAASWPEATTNASFSTAIASDGQGHNLVYGIDLGGVNDGYTGTITCVNDNLQIHSDWSNNPIYFPSGSSNARRSKCWNGSYHAANDEFLVPVFRSCPDQCSFAGKNAGDLYLYRFDAEHGYVKGPGNGRYLYLATAFDLRADACETSDGGMAVVSSAKTLGYDSQSVYTAEIAADIADGTYDIFPPNPSGGTITDEWKYWDTDARVVKLDGNSNILWQKQFDAISDPLPARQPFPGNVKRQECMYSISEAEDGGLVIAGNTGGNFDDFYLAKIKSGCAANKYLAAGTHNTNSVIVEDEYIYNQTVTWNQPITIYDKVTVETGSTLIIDGATVQFAGMDDLDGFESYAIDPPFEPMIVVEKGAYLLIKNGATLTNLTACGGGSLWKGIEVHGTPNLNQTATNQGKVRIQGESTIENAYTGIRADNYAAPFSHAGGIIQAIDANFHNNNWDLVMAPYQNYSTKNPSLETGNISYFWKCDFTTDDNYVAANIGEQAILFGVNAIPFRGCKFRDDRSGSTDQQWRNENGRTGIYSIWASFQVNEYCGGGTSYPPPPSCGGTRSEFNNLLYGIRALGESNPARFNIGVRNSDFDCHNGMYFSDQSSLAVLGNELDVKGRANATELPYGIYLDNSYDYQVENNTLTGDYATNPGAFAAGIVAYNQHDANTEIYRNTFIGNAIALEPIGQNRNININFPSGLQLKCNDISTGVMDVAVLEAPNVTSPVVGIAKDQGAAGSSTSLAGNLFGNSSPQLWINLYNTGEHFNYHHHDPTTESRVKPNSWTTNNITLMQSSIPYSENACPDHLTGGGSSQSLMAGQGEKQQFQLEADALRTELQQLVDGGNTEALRTEVVFANNQNGYNRYTQLMDNTGYVSETVLKEVSAKEQGLSEAMVRNVLVANPQAAKSKEVKEVLDNRFAPLPNYMRQQINQGKNVLSAKELKEGQLAAALTKRDKAIDLTLRTLRNDTIDRLDDMVQMLSGTEDVNHAYRLAALYNGTGRAEDAKEVLENLLSRSNLPAHRHQEVEDLLHLRQLQGQWKQEGKHLNSLTLADVQELQVYEYGQGKASTKARQILAINDKLTYREPVLMPEPIAAAKRAEEAVEENESMFEIYPNPASEYVTVSFDIPDNSFPLSILIVDIQGRVVRTVPLQGHSNQMVVVTEGLSGGNYHFLLISNNTSLADREVSILN